MTHKKELSIRASPYSVTRQWRKTEPLEVGAEVQADPGLKAPPPWCFSKFDCEEDIKVLSN